jgi:hypothetical protein
VSGAGAKFQGGASRLRGVPPRRQLGPACGPGYGGIQSALQQLRSWAREFHLGRFHSIDLSVGLSRRGEASAKVRIYR